MQTRLIAPVAFGLAGAGILVGLGVWQVQRLHWKEGVLAGMEARIHADPVALPATLDPLRDNYLPVKVSGHLTGQAADVLSGQKFIGPGFRVIAALELADGRRILLDRGFVAEADRRAPRKATELTVTGNLLWPDDLDSFTPPPDLKDMQWFARDLPSLSQALDTEPVLVVAKSDTGDGIMPLPVDTSTIPNDHLNYAITWFSLAAVWLGMTLFWTRRIAARKA